MTRVMTASKGDLRVILCLAFSPDATLDQVQALERFLIDRAEVLHAAEVEGSFDFLVEAGFGELSSFHAFMEQFSNRFAPLLRKKKICFVCRRFIAGTERSVWVHDNGRRIRVDLDQVDEVIADGDYVRLRTDGHDYLYHSTMRAIEAMLDPVRYLRVHRSVIVRLSRVERLDRDGRHWVVACRDGTRHRIAKDRVADLLGRLTPLSSTVAPVSPTPEPVAESRTLHLVE